MDYDKISQMTSEIIRVFLEHECTYAEAKKALFAAMDNGADQAAFMCRSKEQT